MFGIFDTPSLPGNLPVKSLHTCPILAAIRETRVAFNEDFTLQSWQGLLHEIRTAVDVPPSADSYHAHFFYGSANHPQLSSFLEKANTSKETVYLLSLLNPVNLRRSKDPLVLLLRTKEHPNTLLNHVLKACRDFHAPVLA